MISDTYKPSNETNLRKILNKLPHHPIKSSEGKCPFLQTELVLNEPTQQQIDLVRTSWERVSEIRHDNDDRNVSSSHAFGLAFYDALFDMNIECKHLFTNVFQQARALTGMISFITRAPHISSPSSPTTIRDINAKKRDNGDYDECDPEWFAQQMRELGAKHYFYKVQPHHFDVVGPAFVTALQKRLGDEYTEAIGEAWMKANAYAAYHMKIGFECQKAWEEDPTSDRSSKKIKSSCTIQ
jgi:hemoglobin-like flavoprotein